jgi:hypothetical protein
MFMEGNLVQRGDKEVLIATGATLTITIGDTVIVDSIEYGVVGVQTLEPSGIDLFYRAIIRR